MTVQRCNAVNRGNGAARFRDAAAAGCVALVVGSVLVADASAGHAQGSPGWAEAVSGNGATASQTCLARLHWAFLPIVVQPAAHGGAPVDQSPLPRCTPQPPTATESTPTVSPTSPSATPTANGLTPTPSPPGTETTPTASPTSPTPTPTGPTSTPSLTPTATATGPTATATQTSPASPTPTTVVRAGGIYGVQVFEGDIETIWNGTLGQAGVTWARGRVLWAGVEPADTTPPTRNWGPSDQVFGGLARGGMEIIGVLYENPGWAASTTCGPVDSASLTRYQDFVRDTVERYDGDGIDDAPGAPVVRFWEISNEPDFMHSQGSTFGDPPDGYGGCFGDDPAAYGAQLRAAYLAVKQANPEALVLFGSVAYDRLFDNPDYPPGNRGPFRYNFVRDVLTYLHANHGSEPAWPFFDRMAFHNYNDFRNYWDADGQPEMVGKAQHLRDHQLTVPGLFDLSATPLIASEVGIPSGPTDQWTTRNEEYQAAYVGQVLARAWASGMEAAVWYTAEDNEADLAQCTNPYAWKTHGLMRSTWVAERAAQCPANPLPGYSPSGPHEAKPAYAAMATASGVLGNASFVRRLTAAETGSTVIDAYLLELADGRSAIVAFTDHGDHLGRVGSANQTSQIQAREGIMPGWTGSVRITEYLGETRVETGTTISVPLTFRPTYIVVEP